MKQFFLPIGLILATFGGFFLPACGVVLSDNNGLQIGVIIIFVISGYQTTAQGVTLDRKLCTIFLIAASISLLLAPMLAVLVSNVLQLSMSLAMGLLIISTVPPTLSSGVVITEVSNGNGVLALFLTISLNLLGLFSIPFVLDIYLNATSPIDINPMRLLTKMICIVLLPFILGKLTRKVTGKGKISGLWSYVNSSCVILIVYASLASSKEAFTRLTLQDYLMVVSAVCIVHCSLLVISAYAGKSLHLTTADQKALIFVTSQKTMALALAVLASLTFNVNDAIIVCLVFHFSQLIIDSILASFLQQR